MNGDSIMKIVLKNKFGMTFLLAAGFAGAAFAATQLATVNGKAISSDDLSSALGHLPEAQRKQVLQDSSTRRRVLDTLIDQELMIQTAEKLKLDSDKEFKDAVETFRRQYMVNKLLEKNVASKLTEGSAREFYKNHKERYSTDQVRAQHILLPDEKTANDVLKMAKASGADFQALAEKYSRDPSAKTNRGDLGFFPRDRMVPEFTNVAFNGSKGSIMGPIKTDFGYHLIKIIDKKPGKALNFEEVEMKVRDDLRQELVRLYAEGLRKSSKVQINQGSL